MRREEWPVTDPRIPEGYKVLYCEMRGYDSPDRWHEAWKGERRLGDFAPGLEGKLAAIQACVSNRDGWEKWAKSRCFSPVLEEK